MLEARSVSVAVRGRLVLENVDLRVEPGKVHVVVGPNGAGKTTVLRILAREWRPNAGRVLLDGIGIEQISARELARRRAIVPQVTALSFPFTAREVVALGASVPGFELADRRIDEAADAAMGAVGLAGFEDRLYAELSCGERQRIHIARALCQLCVATHRADETTALLLDEPTANLDLAHQTLVLDEVRRQARAGRAVFAILHDLNLAAAYADEIIVMAPAVIAARGPPERVFEDVLLSRTFGCPIKVNRTPPDGTPFFLPQAMLAEGVALQPAELPHLDSGNVLATSSYGGHCNGTR